MPKCWACGKTFQLPEDEYEDHGCPNRMCRDYDLVAGEGEEDGDTEEVSK